MKTRRILKKATAFFLAFIMVFGAAPVSELPNLSDLFDGFGLSAQAASESDLRFVLINGGTEYEVSDCIEAATGALTIPTTYNGKPVTSIGSWAFYNCTSLSSITIPDSVTNIGNYAFMSCEGLRSVTVGNSVTNIGSKAFLFCIGLTDIMVSSANANYSSQDGVLFNKSKTEIIKHPIGNIRTNYSIPDSVKYICYEAFKGCTGLNSITISDSVTSIGNDAFNGCTGLSSITIPDSVTSIGYCAFEGCTGLSSITISDSVESIGNYAFKSCEGLSSVTVGNSVESIGSGAFLRCTNIGSITIPNSVTSIDTWAFSGCTSLSSVTIPDSVTNIGVHAFSECSRLTSITIPNSVESIGDRAFLGCTRLTSITIPNSVTSIGDFAFNGCTNNLIIYGDSNSYAQKYAEQQGIMFKIRSSYPYGMTLSPYQTFPTDKINVKVSNIYEVKQDGAEAIITVEGIGTKKVDEDGIALFDNTLTSAPQKRVKVIAKAAGYRDHIRNEYIVAKDIGSWRAGANHAYITLEKLRAGDNVRPYISTLRWTESWREPYYFSAFARHASYKMRVTKTWSPEYSIKMEGFTVWNGKQPGKYVFYQIKSGISCEYSALASSFDIDLGYTFAINEPIYVKAVAKDGTESAAEEIAFVVEKEPEESISKTMEIIPMTTGGGQLPDSTPFLADHTLKSNLSVPFTVTVSADGSKTRIAVGVEGAEELFNDNDEWTEWKKFCDDFKNDNWSVDEYNKYIKKCKLDVTSTLNLDCEAMGYIEFSSSDQTVEGGITVSADAYATFQTQYVIGIIPVYAKLGIGIKLNLEMGAGYNFSVKKAYAKGNFSLSPYLCAEAGLGVLYAATVGLVGQGSIPINASGEFGGNNNDGVSVNSVKLDASLRIEAKVLAWEYVWNLGHVEKTLYQNSKANQICSTQSFADNNQWQPSSSNAIEGDSVWYGSTKEATPKSVSSGGINERVLQSNVYSLAKPEITKVSGTYVATWLAIDKSRNAVNATELVYSVLDPENNTWSEPKPVCDDGTADFYPSVSSNGTKLYIAWQNISEEHESDATMFDFLIDSEIATAEYDPETKAFINVVRVTNNKSLDMTPDVIVDNSGNSYVAWIANSENDIFGANGNSTVMCASTDGTGTKNLFVVQTPIASMDTTVVDETVKVAYSLDTDGDIGTIADREIFEYSDENGCSRITDNTELDSNPQYCTYKGKTALLWCSEKSFNIRLADGTIETIYSTDNEITSDNINVLKSDSGQMSIVWSACTDDNTKDIQGIIYDSATGTWSKKIDINCSEDSVLFPTGYIDGQGNIQVMYNKTFEVDSNTKSDLCITTINPYSDLTVLSAMCDLDSLKPSAPIPMTLIVKNNGVSTINSLNVDVDSQVTTINETILPGEEKNIQFTYMTDSTVQQKDIIINITPGSTDDINPNDNVYTLTIGKIDLSISVYDEISADSHYLTIFVENESYTDTDAVINFRLNSKDGEIFDSVDFKEIKGKERYTFAYRLSNEITKTYTGLKRVYITLDSGKDELYDVNNYEYISLLRETYSATGVSVNKSSLELREGQSEGLVQTVSPDDATNKNVTWISSDDSVATVSATGVVTAVSAGTAVITVITFDGEFKATCSVTVVSATVPVTDVTVSPTSKTLAVGATQQLTATVTPSNATNKNVTWSSSNTAVATVSATGLVTAKAAGTAVITVKTANGNKTATCAITVTTVTVAVTGVTVAPTSKTLEVGATQQLTATVAPLNATNKNVTWSSSNTATATVDANGLVTAKAAGTAVITVKTADGNKTATCAITVKTATVAVTGVTVAPTSKTLEVGATQQLTATVAPSNATNKNVTWLSSNTSVATVSSTGLVTAKAAGTATITATTADGSKTATCAVTVICPTITIKNHNKITSINYGETLKLTVTTTDMPEGAKIEWSVQGSGVTLKASADGTTCDVTSIASGTVTITAKIVNADDKPITDAEGNEIAASQQIKSNAGFFQKLASFFKNLFRISRIIVQYINK